MVGTIHHGHTLLLRWGLPGQRPVGMFKGIAQGPLIGGYRTDLTTSWRAGRDQRQGALKDLDCEGFSLDGVHSDSVHALHRLIQGRQRAARRCQEDLGA